ncbi:MAG: glycoside hydrolase family 2 protein, partial [Bacteroidia bacterium]
MNRKLFHILFCLMLFLRLPAQPGPLLDYPDEWSFHQAGDSNWYTPSVPGSIYSDLLSNKLIPDPFVGTNEKEVQWVQEKEWEYVCKVNLSAKEYSLQYTNADLVCEGLDTYASVYFNDSLVMETNNMFRTWRADIKKLIRQEKNSIRIVFHPNSIQEKQAASKLNYTLPEGERVFTRKAQYSYGWDFAPKLPAGGIRKPVSLHFWNDARLEAVRFIQQSADSAKASGTFKLEILCTKAGNYDVFLNQEFFSKKKFPFRLKKGKNSVEIPVYLDKPKLWWCNGMGDPNLYQAGVYLTKNDQSLDSRTISIGFHTLELVQEKDVFGKSFYFKLNGKPLFIKGANYVPSAQPLPLYQITQAHFNMLRVWGGGIYENDEFYNSCDEYGLLVWQDLMFACAMYPGDSAFVKNVREEITEQVLRLQSHPSIALWCGNNESDEGWKNWGWQKQLNYSKSDSTKIEKDYTHLFHKVIPSVLKELDPGRAYWPSSPFLGWGHKESLLEGDSHYWGVWWGKEPFEAYEKKVGRFVSEYGFQSLPSVFTYKKICGDSLSLVSPCVQQHQKHKEGFAIIDEYMKRDYVIPTAFEDYIYISQLLQAEGMRTAIEAQRRARPYCMGTLFWQLNDCWPAASWSAIDHYGNRKATFYQAKRSYKNVLLSVHGEQNNYNVYLVSDEIVPLKGNVEMKLCDFHGKILWSQQTPVIAEAGSSSVCYSIPAETLNSFDKASIYLTCSFTMDKYNFTEKTVYYF